MGIEEAPRHLASIVVPVYNAQPNLCACLDSLLAQTYENIELICVDDGSTDDSPAVLADYAARDARVRVLTQENRGPGAARNAGMDAASGEYLYFFDCDDWCEPTLLERAVARLDRTGADLIAFPYFVFDERVGVAVPASWALLPDRFPGETSCWRDNPDWLFRTYQNLPWNKLFRRSFVCENNLRFQEDVRLTEDLMFSAPAIVRARRMTMLDDVLIYHREGTGANTMAKKDRHPLDFLTAFRTLRAWLVEEGVYEELRIAYANWAIDGFIYNLYTLNTFEAFEAVLRELTEGGGIAELELDRISLEDLHEDRYREFLRIVQLPASECAYRLYVMDREERDVRGLRVLDLECGLRSQVARAEEAERRCAVLEDELASCRDALAEAQRSFDEMLNAAEQRVGAAICWVPRRIQEAILRRR